MKRVMIALMVASAILVTGCQSTSGGKLSFNMTQSLSRGAGDAAMTALLDEGVDAKQARAYVIAISEVIGKGEIDKYTLRTACYSIAKKLKLTNIGSYIDALMLVIPGEIAEYQKIPEQYRTAILSFLDDGAIRALDLYKAEKLSLIHI